MTSTDGDTFDRLLEHRDWVRRLVRSLVVDPARADDVEQQVWLSALERAPSHVERPRAWLAAVARNWVRLAHRGESRRARRESVVARVPVQRAGDDPVERAEAHRAVVDAVLRLQEPFRTTVLLHYFEGLTVGAAAARLGVPLETVRSRLRLARERLRAELAEADGRHGVAWIPGLLALVQVPQSAAGPAVAALPGGTIAMVTMQQAAFASVVLASAVGAAWLTARAAAPAAAPANVANEGLADIAARVDRIEKGLEAQRTARLAEEHGLARRVGALEARTGDAPAAPPRDAAGEAVAPSSPTAASKRNEATKRGDAAAEDAQLAIKASRMKVDLDREADIEMKRRAAAWADPLTAEPGTPEHRDAMKKIVEQLVKSAGPPPVDSDVAILSDLLDREARRGRISAEEALDVVPLFDTLAVGSVARPGLAKAVAGGWGKDGRLSDFLGKFPANAEPRVHLSLLQILDHTPSPAFSDYVMRLVREERDPKVLASAVDEDRVDAAAPRDVALRFAQTVETRLQQGNLDADARLRLGYAIAAAGLHVPADGAAILQRLASQDGESRVSEAFRQAATSLTDRSATQKSLKRLFTKR